MLHVYNTVYVPYIRFNNCISFYYKKLFMCVCVCVCVCVWVCVCVYVCMHYVRTFIVLTQQKMLWVLSLLCVDPCILGNNFNVRRFFF